MAGGVLLGSGWSAQGVVLAAVAPALLASVAVFTLRHHSRGVPAGAIPATLAH